MLRFNQLSYRFSSSGFTVNLGVGKKIEPQNKPKAKEKSMFRKSPTKKNLKPTVLGLAKYAAKFKATLEFDLQTFNEDANFDDQLKKIIASFQMIEKGLTEKTGDTVALAKEFQKQEELLEKILAKLRDVQEKFSNAEKTLHDKLTGRLKDVKPSESSNSKSYDENKKRLEQFLREIETLIASGKQKVTQLQIDGHAALKIAFNLKPLVTQFLLPECMDQCDKQARKLSERLEFLCKVSADIDANRKEASAAEKVNAFLPQLSASLKTCGQLFEQATRNLKPSADVLKIINSSHAVAAGLVFGDAKNDNVMGANGVAGGKDPAIVPVAAAAANASSAKHVA